MQQIDRELSGIRQSIRGWQQTVDNYDDKISTLDELLKKAEENQKQGIKSALDGLLKRKTNAEAMVIKLRAEEQNRIARLKATTELQVRQYQNPLH